MNRRQAAAFAALAAAPARRPPQPRRHRRHPPRPRLPPRPHPPRHRPLRRPPLRRRPPGRHPVAAGDPGPRRRRGRDASATAPPGPPRARRASPPSPPATPTASRRALGRGAVALYAGETPCPLVGRVSMDLSPSTSPTSREVPDHLDDPQRPPDRRRPRRRRRHHRLRDSSPALAPATNASTRRPAAPGPRMILLRLAYGLPRLDRPLDPGAPRRHRPADDLRRRTRSPSSSARPSTRSSSASQLLRIGYFSLPVVGLTALFTGAALALQIYSGGNRFNAGTVVPSIVAIGIVRELGPVLGGLMVAGRVSSSIAAELGTMRVTEQIDALTTLSTDPMKYLVLPAPPRRPPRAAAARRRRRRHRHLRRLPRRHHPARLQPRRLHQEHPRLPHRRRRRPRA